jgi:holo-[acyl-carrier protein] synthase
MNNNKNVTGLGTDIIAIARFNKSIEKYGKKFLDKIFTAAEQEYCDAFSDSAPRYAARFSAKEAVSKALGCGIGENLGFHDIEILKDDLGKPYIKLSPSALAHFNDVSFHLSISHCKEYATAVAIAMH